MGLRKYLRKLHKPVSQVVERACEADYALLHTLCTVWPEGPMAQAYLKGQDRSISASVATELRLAISSSWMVDTEIGQDHIQLLRRLEAQKP
jgi:hypothetical protein